MALTTARSEGMAVTVDDVVVVILALAVAIAALVIETRGKPKG